MINVYFLDTSVPAGLRYVRKHPNSDFYIWATRSAVNVGFDHARGTCEADDLPPHVREACDRTEGMNSVFYASEWP